MYIFSLGEEIMKMLNNLTETEILSLSKEGDNEALTFIITRYRAAVEVLASKYSDSPIEREDLIQEGMIGLLAAIKSYDSSKGASFKTYSKICVDNAMQTALRKFKRFLLFWI